jgi:hypothetical protein
MSGITSSYRGWYGQELISVVGGGPSVGRVNAYHIPGLVIGVNSAFAYGRCDIILSMDRLWAEHNWAALKVASLPTFVRRSALKNCQGSWDGLVSFECNHLSDTFSELVGTLNGFNSGFCALNLAYQLRPKRLYLFGFDMKRDRDRVYWYPHYAWRPQGGTSSGLYKRWAGRFENAAKQFDAVGIEVTNACADSAITVFKRTDPRKLV